MAKNKKLDIFNLFYSGAAVIILIGVIAKILEWPSQDLLITDGLAIEALVFAVSAVKFIEINQPVSVNTTASQFAVQPVASQFAVQPIEDELLTSRPLTNNTPPKTVNTPTYANTNVLEHNILDHNRLEHNILGQLEKLYNMSITKDLFFQAKWDELSAAEYGKLSNLFKRIFDKKLPSKETLPFLNEFPVKLPTYEINKLSIDKPQTIDASEIHLLCKALKMVGSNQFFDNFIVELKGGSYSIREKKLGDLQVYGGENEDIVDYINTYLSNELIVSPNVECLQSSIHLKGQSLIEFLIQKVDIKNETELSAFIALLKPQSDELKTMLWSRFKVIKYDLLSNKGYNLLKLLVQSAATFSNPKKGSQLFVKLVEFHVGGAQFITLNDVVHFSEETIYFGPNNEYPVHLRELFNNGELENSLHVQSIIKKLVFDEVAPKSTLMQLFNLNEIDTKKEVFDKLNYHISNSNMIPSGAQLAFVLLYKQYSNSKF